MKLELLTEMPNYKEHSRGINQTYTSYIDLKGVRH